MKKIFTLFLSILFSSFLLGQGCPTSVDTDGLGRILFHYADNAAMTTAWSTLPGGGVAAITITGGSIDGTNLADPLVFGKTSAAANRIVGGTSSTADFFRSSGQNFGTANSTFTGTITFHYTTGDVVCNYADGILPVKLVHFNSEIQEKTALLSWTTASEVNNEGFEIEKSSNGSDWKVIGWVNGNGRTANHNFYTYFDNSPFIGMNYYRLKQIDFDGQFDFSDIVTLRYDVKNIVVEVSPNPSPGIVNVTVLNPDKEEMKIELYNSAGSLIWRSNTLNNLDTWKKEFNLIQKEMHFISVQIGKEIHTKKILIIN